MTHSIKSFGVVGSGLMGRGIAEVAAVMGGFEKVVLHDAQRAQLDSAAEAIGRNLALLVDQGKLEKAAADRARACLTVTAEAAELVGCGFVVEAVTEQLEVKAGVFEMLGRSLGPEAIVASNTSAIPITRLAANSARPERVIGLHFMNPAPRMRGVEVIRGLRTSPETYRATVELAARFGKEVTASRDRAGFVVNRILYPLLNAAAAAVDGGLAEADALDKLASIHPAGPRLPMGPLMLADLIGLDTVQHILGMLAAELAPHFAPAALIERLVERGALGAKAGRGFYLWEGGRPRGPNPLVAELRGRPAGGAPPADPAAMARRAWLAMANEAVRVVEEGTSSVADVERGCLHCLNHRVGILAALDKFGIGEALAGLLELEARFGAAYQPAALLRRLVEGGQGGKAAGAGIYCWEAGQDAPVGVNPVLKEYLTPASCTSST